MNTSITVTIVVQMYELQNMIEQISICIRMRRNMQCTTRFAVPLFKICFTIWVDIHNTDRIIDCSHTLRRITKIIWDLVHADVCVRACNWLKIHFHTIHFYYRLICRRNCHLSTNGSTEMLICMNCHNNLFTTTQSHLALCIVSSIHSKCAKIAM